MCSKLCFLSIVLNLANMQVHKLQAADNWPVTSLVNYQATTVIADMQKDRISCHVTTIDKSKRLHSAQCKPRPHVVSIMETFGKNTPTGVLNPTHIETMRCSGICSHNKQCMPKEIHYLQMPVTVIYMKDTDNKGTVKECVTTVVEYHESCSCKCANSADCNNKQMQRFNEESCKCECIDSSYMQQYCRRRRNIWDESTCRCKCRRRPTCSTGSVFHPDKCICIRVEDDVHWKSKHP